MTHTEGNKLIAQYLGYEYISSVNPEHERPNGINYGYWRLKSVDSFAEFLKLGKSRVYKHGAKLNYHEDYRELMDALEMLEAKDGVIFHIDGRNVFVIESLGSEMMVDVTADTKKMAIWRAMVEYMNKKSQPS